MVVIKQNSRFVLYFVTDKDGVPQGFYEVYLLENRPLSSLIVELLDDFKITRSIKKTMIHFWGRHIEDVYINPTDVVVDRKFIPEKYQDPSNILLYHNDKELHGVLIDKSYRDVIYLD